MTRTSSRPLAGILAAGALTLFSLGCRGAVVGQWKLERAIPSREFLALDDVSFNKDGSYAATLTRDGQTTREQGRFDFNGFNLWLEPQAGGRREFGATLKTRRLELRDGNRKVILRKVGS
ncbi:MAG: hypothetical protein LC135_04790 [Phycisphaerae bacterium]|jgi:hypothetical protein|nr:hypothetical protein [Phycisphaerae bacterium]MCZ2399171.1 hypothetical protein [Phycisphaerae bacterium]NUQ49980.1 hypothetical protein [Phycisphaerae bacterium]